MALLKCCVSIEGIRPLLWHHFAPEMLAADPAARMERRGTKGNDPSEWKRTALVTAGRQLYLRANYVYSCLRDAGRYTRAGKGSLQPLIAATVQVLDEQVLIDRFLPADDQLSHDSGQPVYIDVQMVRNPATRARNVRYRLASSSGWKAQFGLVWEGSLINREQMGAVLRDAGALVGLGDGRGIGYGRFRIVGWQVSELAVQTDATVEGGSHAKGNRRKS